MTQNPNLQVDDNWKEQAEREKESLAGKPAAPTEAPARAEPAAAPAHSRRMPAASLELIVEMFAMQAMLGLGSTPDPATGKAQKDLEMSRHFIDLLAVIGEKSKGNLSKEEQGMLDATLYQLRMQYVDATKKG